MSQDQVGLDDNRNVSIHTAYIGFYLDHIIVISVKRNLLKKTSAKLSIFVR